MIPFVYPLRIHRPRKNFPYITVSLIIINVIFFALEWYYLFTDHKALIEIIKTFSFQLNSSAWYTWFTAMFLHDPSILPLHLVSNMYFLYLFGSLVEDAIGRIKFISVYLISGLLGCLLFGVVGYANGSVQTGAIGASGAIAGLMGIAMMRFKENKVTFGYFILVFFYPMYGTFTISVFIAILVYFGLQLLNGVLFSIMGVTSMVAYWGHLGGFLAGLLAVKFLKLDFEADIEGLEQEAASDFRTGDFYSSALKYEKLIKDEPNNATYQHYSGKMWALAGEQKKSAMRFLKSLDLFLKKGQKEEASQVYEDFLEFHPDYDFDDKMLFKIGVLCEAQQKFEAARETFQKLLDEHPDSSKCELAAFRLAQVQLDMGLTSEAKEQLKAFVEKYPQSEWVDLAKEMLKEGSRR